VIDVSNKESRKSFVDWISERWYGNDAPIISPTALAIAQPTQ